MKANFEKGTKICSSCKRELSIEAYNKCKTTNDGLCYKCRECEKAFRQSEKGKEISKRTHQRYQQTEAGKETAKRARQKYYQTEKGKECQRRTTQNYQQTEAGKETYRKAAKKYNDSEKGKKRKSLYEKNKRSEDENFLIAGRCRVRFYSLLKGSKNELSEALLGCSWEELKKHLELQFQEGMSWDNKSEWHIDHIIPCAAFDLADPIQQKICFNWRNLQPLWKEDNLSKNASIPEGYQDLLNEIRTALNIEDVVELKEEE